MEGKGGEGRDKGEGKRKGAGVVVLGGLAPLPVASR